jgi:hypothetical protein
MFFPHPESEWNGARILAGRSGLPEYLRSDTDEISVCNEIQIVAFSEEHMSGRAIGSHG